MGITNNFLYLVQHGVGHTWAILRCAEQPAILQILKTKGFGFEEYCHWKSESIARFDQETQNLINLAVIVGGYAASLCLEHPTKEAMFMAQKDIACWLTYKKDLDTFLRAADGLAATMSQDEMFAILMDHVYVAIARNFGDEILLDISQHNNQVVVKKATALQI